MTGRIAIVVAALALAACASIVAPSDSTVQIRTNPANARCELKGRGSDFAASVVTPASVAIPNAAAPVTVSCQAPGFKPTVHSLDLAGNNWIWSNAGLVLATGGVAIIGAVVDTSTGASRSFKEDASFDLDADKPRLVKTKSRAGGQELDLQAR